MQNARMIRIAAASLLLMWAAASPLYAQFDRRFLAGGRNVTIQGVYIDAKGVLRYRDTKSQLAGKFRANRRLKPSLVTISLPKLFREVKRLAATGKPVPDRMRYFDGMVKLQYVLVDPESKDLLIAGPAEPIDAAHPLRPRGKRTGRPVLQLDDFVVALQSVGPNSRSSAFGCTLQQDANYATRVAAMQKRLRGSRSVSPSRVRSAMKEALGPLEAKFFGVPADTRVAFVCLESDYRMKRISLGLDRPAVPGLRSYLGLSGGRNLLSWFWFVADYPPLSVSADGNLFEIPAHGLKLNANNTAGKGGNPSANKFAELFTRKMPQLEKAVPGFADLQNLTDLAVLAALIDSDNLHAKVGWDLSWFLKRDGYPVARVPTARTAEPLVNSKTSGRRTVTVAGGVQLAVRRFVSRRKKTKPAFEARWKTDLRTDARNWSRRFQPVQR